MNVREDKMTNYWGLQTRKPSLTCCVPELVFPPDNETKNNIK